MNDNLFIDLESTQFQPEMKISGKILWALDKDPKELRLTLGWSTQGRGSSDHKAEDQLNWKTNATSGEETFEFTLPATPYSFEGKLIALNWELSLTAKKGKAQCQLPITVSPHGSAIELPVVNDERKRKSFSIGSR
ncbi:MAG TPA: hypothetical protein DCX06_00280 [Opitutae bacterium]|nr:hypothetical protein [Opitutae bacterium]